MDKKYALVGTVWVTVVVAVLLTNSFLPPMLKENLELYESHEYSQMYLEGEPYSELVIEYDYVPGYKPDEEAMDLLEKRIEEYTDKEEIESKIDDTISEEHLRATYDRNDLSDLKEAYKDYERRDNKISIHVLYLNGIWEETPNVLGLSKKPYNIVVFQSTINSFAAEIANLEPSDIEPAVLVHEFGHLLSLVGTGYESDHQVEDSYHCNEEVGPCVMAESVEFKNHTDQEPPPTDFCELCQEDLEYIREMGRGFGLVEVITYSIIGVEVIIGVGVSITIILWKDEKEPPPPPYQTKGWYADEESKDRWREDSQKVR